MSTTAIDDFPYISNEDVNVLYDIVSAAEASRGPPFRALFAAYDHVLKQHGIEAAKDQVYFRFLLRMREQQKPGQGLLTQFQSLLRRLGIQVDFGDGEDNQEDEEDEADTAASANDTRPFTAQGAHLKHVPRKEPRPQVPRRASFSSFQENTSTHLLEAELNKRINRPRSIDFDESRRGRREPDESGPLVKTSTGSNTTALPNSKRVGGQSRKHKDEVAQPRRTIEHVPSRLKAIPKSMQSTYAAKDTADLTVDESEMSGYSSDLTEEYTQDDIQDDVEQDMLQAAKTLQFHHVAAQCTKIFRDWTSASNASRETRLRLEKTAEGRYNGVLQRSVIEQWTSALTVSRGERETANFFETLEIKAGKARDVFLLTKAFTHWAACAEDQVLRSSAARRHILRTRYFNAWRDITAVNELKVRRMGLHKFMEVWKRRTAKIIAQQEAADDLYARNLEKAAYNTWFWKFCERRAPPWYGSKVKANLLEKWLEQTREIATKASWAEDFRRVMLIRKVLVKWAERLAASRLAEQKATEFRKQKLLKPIIDDLQREVDFAPSLEQILDRVDRRILYTALSDWAHRAKLNTQAARVNESRIMRNAWTAWNDQLRCQALQRTVDERIKTECLYKWALAERLAVFERVAREKLKQQVFANWRFRTNEIGNALGSAQRAASQSRNHHSKAQVLQRWVSRSRPERQNLAVAEAFRKKYLLSDSLGHWIINYRHVQHLETRANHAGFFVLASQSLKQWREATSTVQRNKRRAAYAAVRRLVKTNAARSTMKTWHDKYIELRQMDTLATETHTDHTLVRQGYIFETWYSRTLTVFSSVEQAADFHDSHLVVSTFSTLHVRLAIISTLNAQAEAFIGESISATASFAMRQLNRQLFQLKRNDETAERLAERTRKRHHKGMLKWWAEQAARRRGSTSVSNEQPVQDGSERTRGIAMVQTPFRRTANRGSSGLPPMSTITAARRHVLSAFDDSSKTVTQQTTPGYLRTPSRYPRGPFMRSAAVSTTPAGLPPVSEASTQPDRPNPASLILEIPIPSDSPQVAKQGRGRARDSRLTPFMNRLRGEHGARGLSLASSLRADDSMSALGRSGGPLVRSRAEQFGGGGAIIAARRPVPPGPDDTIVEDDDVQETQKQYDVEEIADTEYSAGDGDQPSPSRPRASRAR